VAGFPETILVTGAAGHIGQAVCAALQQDVIRVLPVDIAVDLLPAGGMGCDLRRQEEVARLFEGHSIGMVIHAAAILPSAFHSVPIAGVESNLSGSIHLLRHAVRSGVRRFVFLSSMSVYGSRDRGRALREDDDVIPDEPYGSSKRAIESIGETLRRSRDLDFISLRVARVVGSGARNTSSLWRSQIFQGLGNRQSIHIPFASDAVLSLVHVDDVAQMLKILLHTNHIEHSTYNTPVELWTTGELKSLIQKYVSVDVQLGDVATAGPACDGSRFAKEFNFRVRGLEDRLSTGKR